MALSQKFDQRAPTLWVHPEAFEKIMQYIRLCPVEINGFGYLTRHDAHTLILASPDDVFITHQEVSMGSADVDASTVGLAMAQAAAEGRGSDLRLQWHSHVNGSAYFSSTDIATIDVYGEAGSTWMVSMVLNKRGEFSARLDVYSPVRAAVEMQLLKLPYDSNFADQCRADMEAMVLKRVPRPKKKPLARLAGFAGSAMAGLVDGGDLDEEAAELFAAEAADDEPTYDLIGVFEDPPRPAAGAAPHINKKETR